MTALRLAVFDCDGTLIDSQANILRAMSLCFTEVGLPAPEDHLVRRIVGLSLNEAMERLVPEADAPLHAELANCYKTAFQRLRADDRLDPEPLFDGILPLIDRLVADGWLLAVATGKSDRGLQYTLDHHGIADRFISLQTADRHPSKPHPAMLLAAMTDAGTTAHESVIIGDTQFDIGMGAAAGVRALGVAWGYHDPHELMEAGADAVASDAVHLGELLHG